MENSKHLPQTVIVVLVLLAAWLLPVYNVSPLVAEAISTDYPVQLMNISAKDNKSVLTENGTSDGSALSLKALGGGLAGSWRFDRVNTDSKGTFFKICSAESGRLLTPAGYSAKAGTSVIMYGSESHQTQHWYVVPVKDDRLGNNLYYKIVNYSDTSLALTQGKSGMSLETYKGSDNQLWLLNPDGLQGFAGYCNDDNTGSIKAGDIGGLFGETVEVSNFNDLKKYAESDTPYTIVVTENIGVTTLKTDSSGHYYCPDGRIYVHSNKTIIGSYSKHSLRNVQFCTASSKGVGSNIIIRNFEMQHDEKSNGNDSIVMYFGSGVNLWADHITFVGHSAVNTQGEALPDWDKFLACCYDADYCTVSDCSFGLHEYGVILGYPDDTEDSFQNRNNYPRMTMISNQFTDTLTRAPGLMRYGYYHSLNNCVYNFSMAYTVHSDSKIYAENCYYDGGSVKGNVICDWNEITHAGSYAEDGSEFANCRRTTIEGSAKNCTWRPKNNYDYVKLSAGEAKNYCSTYSGSQSSKDAMKYVRFSKNGMPSAGFTTLPDGDMTTVPTPQTTTTQTTTTTSTTTTTTTTAPKPVAVNFRDGETFRIKNADTGLYMQVAGAEAANGANVQQWGSDGKSVHDIWKMFSAGNGYYYIASCVGDGGTYVLDVAGKKTANGTNIDIYQYNGGKNQQFMIMQNSDGSYRISTGISNGKSVVEVAGADKQSGANVQQWEANNAACQNWIFETAADSGCAMNEDLLYTFENANSGLIMEVSGGVMEDNTNVQQWSSNGYDCQKWSLKAFGSGNYYWIRSAQDDGYALKTGSSSNGGNIYITPYSTKDSSQLFRFTKNLDGSYSIITHASQDRCFVETAAASNENGANVQQWENTGSPCQKWNVSGEKKPEKTITGDVNKDGKCNTADLVLLEKWLLSVSGTELPDWKAADLNSDNVLDVFDLCLMRRELLNQQN